MLAMIDLATTGLSRSPRNQKVTSKRIFGLFTLFCFGTSQTVKPSTGDHRADTAPENEGGPPSTGNTPANKGETADQAPIDQPGQSELQMPAMIDLATTGLRCSPRNQKVKTKRIFGLFTLFCFEQNESYTFQ